LCLFLVLSVLSLLSVILFFNLSTAAGRNTEGDKLKKMTERREQKETETQQENKRKINIKTQDKLNIFNLSFFIYYSI